MGLIVQIYHGARGTDCTLGGISSRAIALCLVNVDGPFDPSESAPAAMLVKGNLRGTVRIVPAVKVEISSGDMPEYTTPGRPMMGGNYAATSDSRFSDACEKITGATFYGAVAIHDRYE
jgi:hypothetical protein